MRGVNKDGQLTETAMAKALGVTPAAVHQQKVKGMPMTSVDAAKAWRANNMGRRGGRGSKARATATTKPAALTRDKTPPPPAPESSDTPELDAAKALCRLCYNDALTAEGVQARATAIQAYQRATDGLCSLQREMEAQALAAGLLLNADHVRAVVSAGCGQLRSLMENLPANVAPSANPADPELAEGAVRDAIEQILATLSNDTLFALDN
jgi:hypothetical protein